MKILMLDIETSPNVGHVWALRDQTISLNQLISSSSTLCFAAMWYGSDEVIFDSVNKTSHKRMVKHAHQLLDEADVVASYNGKRFDIPTLNKEFLLQGLTPPAPYKQVDLYRTVRQQFRFPSYKLEYVSKALGIGQKVKHAGHELWVQVMAGDAEAWQKMEEYNKQDVVLLAKLYDRLMPWIKGHPNHALYAQPGLPTCPKCGHWHLQRRGYARTQANIYARFQCLGCGGWSREPFSELTREDRGIIMRPTE